MSEGRRTPDRPPKNPSWLHSEPGIRTLEWLREHPTYSFRSVLETATREIQERVRRTLTYSSSSSSESNNPVNVITEREFTFEEKDASLLPAADAETRDTEVQADNDARPPLSDSSVTNASGRREFSLTSYDSSRFDPEEIYREMATYRTPAANKSADKNASAANPCDETAVDSEIARMRNELNESSRQPKPGCSRETAPGADSAVMNTLLEEIAALNAKVRTLENREHEFAPRPLYTRPSDQPDVRYSQDDRDEIQNSLMESRPYVSGDGRHRVREARDNVPTFDGSNEDRLQEFLIACEYAYTIIQPTEETALTRAIVCTRLKGGALTEVKNRGVTTYRQLTDTLEACYSRKKSTTRLQRDFNFLRQRHGEEARAYGTRAEKLTLELFESLTEGTSYSPTQRQTIPD